MAPIHITLYNGMSSQTDLQTHNMSVNVDPDLPTQKKMAENFHYVAKQNLPNEDLGDGEIWLLAWKVDLRNSLQVQAQCAEWVWLCSWNGRGRAARVVLGGCGGWHELMGLCRLEVTEVGGARRYRGMAWGLWGIAQGAGAVVDSSWHPLSLFLPFVVRPPHLQSCQWVVRTNQRI